MPRLSKLIEKLEDYLEPKIGPWYERHKKKLPLYIAVGLIIWYFYGMVLNSIRLGTAATFHKAGEEVVESIWVFNPFRNWFVLFTPFGLGATAVIALLVCLFTGTGYKWFSGYKATRDSRGFDILPDGTHGSSGFLTRKEMGEFLEVGTVSEVKGMMLGKYKRRDKDPDKYALYAAHRMVPGDNNNLLCIGAPGSGKSRGFIIPFLLGCAQRGESVFITDPKAELFEKLSPYFREKGHYVKAVNFLDMAHSDGWNCLYGLDKEPQLAQTVANTIIQNTSGAHEADDFWSRAELNLLMALIHYVVNLKDAHRNLLPIEKRGLGDVYQLLAHQSIQDINRTLAQLPPDHPAKGHHGLFLKAKENLWGSIALFQGRKPALLYKLTPEELPGYGELKSCRVADYTPEWRLREEQKKTQAAKKEPSPPPVSGQKPPDTQKQPNLEDEPNPAKDLDYQLNDQVQDLGMVELGAGGVVGGTDEDEELPPGR